MTGRGFRYNIQLLRPCLPNCVSYKPRSLTCTNNMTYSIFLDYRTGCYWRLNQCWYDLIRTLQLIPLTTRSWYYLSSILCSKIVVLITYISLCNVTHWNIEMLWNVQSVEYWIRLIGWNNYAIIDLTIHPSKVLFSLKWSPNVAIWIRQSLIYNWVWWTQSCLHVI